MAKKLKKLRLAELSVVDNPANPHARVTIFKRDVSQSERDRLAGKGQALPDGSFPIANKSDLKNAIQAFGRAKNKAAAKAHIKRRARALGATDMIPESWVSKSEDTITDTLVELLTKSEDDRAETFNEVLAERIVDEQMWPMTNALAESVRSIMKDDMLDNEQKIAMVRQTADEFVMTVQRWLPDALPSLEKALTNGEGEETMAVDEAKFAELQKQVGELTTKLGEVTKRAEDAEAAVAKAAEASDEVLTVSGVDIKKSVVGDATFAVMKSQQEEIAKAKQAEEIAKAQERVEKDFGMLPGDTTAKAAAIVALSKMDGTHRAAVEAMLAAGNKALSDAAETLGGDGGEVVTEKGGTTPAEKKIWAKAAEIQKSDGSLSKEQAFQKAMTDNPDLYAEYLVEKKK